jgi:hypothetical protein
MIQKVEMGTTPIRIVGTGLLFVIIFLSGILLSNSGRPLNVMVFTIHKLIGLAAIIFLAVTIYQINQQAALSATEVIVSVVTGLLFVGTIITGGLVSLEQPVPRVVLTLHQILPILTVLSTVVTLYHLLSRK